MVCYFAPQKNGQSISALPVDSDVNLFGNFECVFNLDTQISNSTFHFGMSQQKLDSPQVAGTAIYQRRLGAPD